MNINMLRDTDNDAGFYVAACAAPGSKWLGCGLYRSSDGGANYEGILSIRSAATIGTTLNALGDFRGGNIPDEINALSVKLHGGTLASTDYAGLINGTLSAVVGDEIIHYRKAALTGDQTYTLTGLLRGRRGSEYAMTGHATGERFVFLNPATLMRVPDVTGNIGTPKLFKAVPPGATLATASAKSFTNAGAGLKPYAPAHLGGGRLEDGSVILKWVRRNRISGEWRDYVDVPVSETGEAYAIEIYSAGFAALKRSLSATTPTVTYSAAQQIADFGGVQTSVYFKVYQLSGLVGRGYPAMGII